MTKRPRKPGDKAAKDRKAKAGGAEKSTHGGSVAPTPTQQAREGPEMGSGHAAQTAPTPQSGPSERGRGVTRTFSTKKDQDQADAEDTLGAGGAGLNLSFDTIENIITINESGQIEFSRLYGAIRAWEASSDGIVHPNLVERSGNIELPDGTRSPRYMILLGGWRLAAADPVWIVGGHLAGRDQDGKGYHPVVEEVRDRVHILDQKPDRDGGVNIEVPVTNFTLTGHAPTVETTPTPTQRGGDAKGDFQLRGEPGSYGISGSGAVLDVTPAPDLMAGPRIRLSDPSAANVKAQVAVSRQHLEQLQKRLKGSHGNDAPGNHNTQEVPFPEDELQTLRAVVASAIDLHQVRVVKRPIVDALENIRQIIEKFGDVLKAAAKAGGFLALLAGEMYAAAEAIEALINKVTPLIAG